MTKVASANTMAKNRTLVKRAVIPFKRLAGKTLEQGEYHTYKLRTSPTSNSSPVYELSVPFFEDGTPEEWLKFCRNVKAVLKGQNVTNGTSMFAVVNTLLRGDALTAFEAAVAFATTVSRHFFAVRFRHKN